MQASKGDVGVSVGECKLPMTQIVERAREGLPGKHTMAGEGRKRQFPANT